MRYEQKEPSRRSLRRVQADPRRERALTREETRTYPDATSRPGSPPRRPRPVFVQFGGVW